MTKPSTVLRTVNVVLFVLTVATAAVFLNQPTHDRPDVLLLLVGYWAATFLGYLESRS